MFKFTLCRCVKSKSETKAKKTSCRSMGALLDLTFIGGKMYHNFVLEITVQPHQDTEMSRMLGEGIFFLSRIKFGLLQHVDL